MSRWVGRKGFFKILLCSINVWYLLQGRKIIIKDWSNVFSWRIFNWRYFIFFFLLKIWTILGLFTFLHNSKFHEAESNKTDHYSTNLPQSFPLVRIFPCINTISIFIWVEKLHFRRHEFEKFEMIRFLL